MLMLLKKYEQVDLPSPLFIFFNQLHQKDLLKNNEEKKIEKHFQVSIMKSKRYNG
jgi:hypothetical protein